MKQIIRITSVNEAQPIFLHCDDAILWFYLQMEYYDNDFLKVKKKVMRVVEEANRVSEGTDRRLKIDNLLL